MKYIKIYEAFQSEILSSTLKFIKDKKQFLDLIKKICDEYNFPISSLSDDFFEYLPFNKALKKTDSLDSLPCDAKSIDLFDDFGIEGEICKRGNIKRKWGKSIRTVKCTKCSGSGIKKKDRSVITLIKFWFNSDGVYIGTTCFNNNISGIDTEKTNFSRNIDDYEIEIENIIDREEYYKLKTGDIVLFQADDEYKPVVAYIIREGDALYAIQDINNGDTPYNINYSHIAKYSWRLGGSDVILLSLLKKKNKEIDNEIDPFKYNLVYNFRYYKPDEYTNSKNYLKDADFSIILDVDKLKKSEYENVSKTRKERLDAKYGSTALISNDEIKKINLDRYVDALCKKMSIYENPSNCNKLISKVLSRDYLMFEFKEFNIPDHLDRLVTCYYNILKENEDYYKGRYIDDLNSYIKNIYEKSKVFSTKINKNILNYKIRLEEVEKPSYFIIIDKITEINRAFYDKITSIDIENIDDLELVISKIRIFRTFFNNERIVDYYMYNYLIDYIYNGSLSNAITRMDSYNIEEQIQKLERLKRLIDKM